MQRNKPASPSTSLSAIEQRMADNFANPDYAATDKIALLRQVVTNEKWLKSINATPVNWLRIGVAANNQRLISTIIENRGASMHDADAAISYGIANESRPALLRKIAIGALIKHHRLRRAKKPAALAQDEKPTVAALRKACETYGLHKKERAFQTISIALRNIDEALKSKTPWQGLTPEEVLPAENTAPARANVVAKKTTAPSLA